MKNPHYRKSISKTESTSNIEDSYQVFLDTIITQSYLIGLYSEEWALCITKTEQKGFVVWNRKKLASALRKGEWLNYKIQKISLKLFIEDIIPYLKEQKYIIALNLSVDGRNIEITPEKLLLDLKSALYKIYSNRPDLYEKLDLPLPRNIRIH